MVEFMPLSLRIARRELRHGWRHFAVFLACLILGIGVMASVGMLGAAIEQTMESKAGAFLGGNAEVSLNGGEASAAQLSVLQHFGLVSHVVTTRAMARYGEQSQLIELKTIDEAYPLLGHLAITGAESRASAFTADTVVVDRSLLDQLGAKLQDEIRIGSATYRIAAILKHEPDNLVQLFAFGPRVMMTHAALQRSGITKGYSLARHRYRILFHGQATLEALEEAVKEAFLPGTWRLATSTEGNRAVERFLGQLTLFLTLSGLAALLIGGTGIAGSANSYIHKKAATIAVMKTLGASNGRIVRIYLFVVGIIALTGSILGILLAAVANSFFLPLLENWLPLKGSAAFDVSSGLLAGWYGLLICFLFSSLALCKTLNIRPSLLFRNHAGIISLPADRRGWYAVAFLGVIVLATLLLHFTDRRFVAGFAGMALLAFALFAGVAKIIAQFARCKQVRRPWLRLALRNLHRPGSATGTVVPAVGISLTLLVAIVLTEANFQRRITEVVKTDAPTLFMIDIQPDQQPEVRKVLEPLAGVDKVMMFPMVRGKIVALNGQRIEDETKVKEEVRWAVENDRGLSYSRLPPENAHIAQGEWWPADYNGAPLVSIDERFLDGMGLKLGDTITVEVLGEEITATVTSARHMDYTTFQMNFALMFSPGVLDRFPQTYLSTVYLQGREQKEKDISRRMAQDFPNVSIIRTKEAAMQVKEILYYVAQALSVTVGVSLAAGILVLIGALSAMLENRLYDTAILKSVGARKEDILKAFMAEWILLAIATGAIAVMIGTFGAWLISWRFPSDAGFRIMPLTALATVVACVVVIGLIGYLGNRRIFALKPARLLRNG